MTKEELSEKRRRAIKSLSDVGAILGLDEMYIDELEKEKAELKKEILEVRQHLDLTEREWGKDTTKLIHYKTQLTKATELLKQFLEAKDGEDTYKAEWEAEQFLQKVK